MEAELRYQQLVGLGKEAARAGRLQRALELLREAEALRPSAKLQRRLERLEEALRAEQEEDEEEEDDEFVAVPGCSLSLYRPLFQRLYPHQRLGVAFLYHLHSHGHPGGILADDMGLGKTVQLVAFLSGMFDNQLIHSCLLLLPSALLHNWAAEFSKWTPGMRVREFHGTKSERTKGLERVQRKGGVVLTSYQMMINNWQQLSSLNGQEFTWDYLVLDEAHKIKTKSTKTTKCASSIPAKYRILLTGTPVQNNLQEMWALFDFACQGSLLGTAKTFKMEYENPITRAREKDATPNEKALGLRISENLMKIIQPYFLRRTKESVQAMGEAPWVGSEQKGAPSSPEEAQMPSLTRKNDLIVWVYLSSVQEDIYNKFVSSEQVQELLETKRSPLVQLTNLKKLCDHPRLLSRRMCRQLGLDRGVGEGEEEEEEDSGATFDISHVPDEDLIRESGKLVFLLGLLSQLREEGTRTLVFSQSRRMLDIIQRILTNRGFHCTRIDGTMSLAERQRKIEAFQLCTDYCVFLLTTQVGGVGLTLTAANRVVIFDPSWNPATDAQAVDRAYRIGQTDNVVIYRLVTCGSVEEKIYRRQIFKDSLVRQSVGEKKNPFRYFSSQELRELFILEDPRTSSTQRQLQSMHSSQRRTDMALDQHIAFLHTLEMFGVTDHDLIFSQDMALDEENSVSDRESQQYIQQRVQKAQELVMAESQFQVQLGQNLRADTEPAGLNRPREPSAIPTPGGGEGLSRTQPQSPSDTLPVQTGNTVSPHVPVMVDLTQSIDKGTAGEVLDLSSRLADLPLETGEQSASVVLLDSSLSPAGTGIAEEDGVVGGDSLIAEPGPTVCQLPTSGNVFSSPLLHNGPQLQLFSSEGQDDESVCEHSASEALSPDFEAPSDSKPLFESGFNLVLEETVEEEEGMDSERLTEAKAPTTGDSCSSIEAQLGQAEQQAVSLDMEFPSSVEADSSDVLRPWKRRQGRVIASDSEEEETKGGLEPRAPEFVSSPMVKAFTITAASTPKGFMSPLAAVLNKSGNRSVASRRSIISQVMDDVEDLDDAEDVDDTAADRVGASNADEGETDDGVSDQNEAEESAGGLISDRSLRQPGKGSEEKAQLDGPALELGTGSSEEGVTGSSSSLTGSSERADSEGEESGTFDSELGSGEQLETFTKATGQLITRNEVGHEMGKYERLVKRGKEQMEKGDLKAALKTMLQALDLQSGDPEVQLITIKLYRQLDES